MDHIYTDGQLFDDQIMLVTSYLDGNLSSIELFYAYVYILF